MAEITSGKLALTLIELHEQPTPFELAPDVFIEDDFVADTLDPIWSLDNGAILDTTNDYVRFTVNGAASDNGFIHYIPNDLPEDPSYWRAEYHLGITGAGGQGERMTVSTYGLDSAGGSGGVYLNLVYQTGSWAMQWEGSTVASGSGLSMPNGVHPVVVEYDGSFVRWSIDGTLMAEWASGPLTFPPSASKRSLTVGGHNGGGISATHYLDYVKFEYL